MTKLTLSVLVSAAILAATSQTLASESGNVKHLKSIRVKQAKELLGRYYKHSVVRAGEKISDVPAFVSREVKENLKAPWKKHAKDLTWTIISESKKYKLDPIFIMSIIDYESSFNPAARGDFGEIGVMQIKPDTAQWIAKKYDIKWKGAKALRNPSYNVKIGAAYVDYLRDRFDNHGRLYLAAYNMGVTNVNRALEKQIWPKDYPSNVMQHYIKFYTELKKRELGSKPVVVAVKDGKSRTPANVE